MTPHTIPIERKPRLSLVISRAFKPEAVWVPFESNADCDQMPGKPVPIHLNPQKD